MRNTRSNTRLWTFGTIALGVAALALVLGTLFASSNAAAQAIGPDVQADSVTVMISDGAIDVPRTVAAGATTFEVTNSGQNAHGLAIGADPSSPVAILEGRLEADQSETLTAELTPGSYMAYCPVEGHQESAEFTVE